MKIRLIADEDISWRIKRLISKWDILPVNEINKGERPDDLLIWRYARDHNYTILTFDEDFSEPQNLYSYPPKIIWL